MAWKEQLSSGRYRGRYRDAHGTLCHTPETFTQPTAALREAWRLEDKARKRFRYRKDIGKQHYREWVEEWWPDRDVEASTLGRDKIRLDKHILPRWGDTPLEVIERSREDIQAWVDELKEQEDLSASTACKIFYLFATSIRAAMIAERIDSTPCVSIKLPPIPPSDERYLDHEEYDTLRAAMPDDRSRLLIDTLVGTGCRWGEMVAIHRRRISRPRRLLDIHEAYSGEARKIKAYPKNKQKRSVPLTDELATALAEWMEHTSARCETPHMKGSRCEHDLLFEDDGQVVDYYHFEKMIWRPAVKDAGIGHVRIHDLRHTYASWLIQKGRPLEEIGDLLGHRSWQTTQRYAHLAKAHWDATREALSRSEPDEQAETEADEGSVRAELERLAAANPEKWGPALAALDGEESPSGETDAAPDLLHGSHDPTGAKIIKFERRRRSG